MKRQSTYENRNLLLKWFNLLSTRPAKLTIITIQQEKYYPLTAIADASADRLQNEWTSTTR